MGESKHINCKVYYEPSTEYHGPYIATVGCETICDFYVMSRPSVDYPSPSRPLPFMGERANDNARRFTAAWNAVENISTEALEAGVVREMVELLKKFSAEADQWADTVSDDYRSPCIEPGAKSAHPGSETVFTIGDLREARTLVAKLGGA